jgi:biotin carboxyl carrier protein
METMNRRSYIVRLGPRQVRVSLVEDGAGWLFEVDGKKFRVDRVPTSSDGAMHLLVNGKGEEIFLRRTAPGLYKLLSHSIEKEAEVYDPGTRRLADSQQQTSAIQEETVRAPIPGSIVRVFVRPGDQVEPDQPLVILEAMKMQNEILSPMQGLVRAVHVEQGQTVLGDEPMVVLSIGS